MDGHRNIYSLQFVESMMTKQADKACGWYKDYSLATVYQPVFSLPHECAIGVAATLRATDSGGKSVASEKLFADVSNFSETLLLDRLCVAMHLHNFFEACLAQEWVFVNVQPGAFLAIDPEDTFFADVLAKYGSRKRKVVLEVSGSVLADAPGARRAVDYYRDLGCLIAIDDFGADNSNIDSILPIQPTFVKIDRSIVARSKTDPAVKRMMPRVVSALHQIGSFVAMEGIETASDAMIAIESDVDFASGYYFASPAEDMGSLYEPESKLKKLWGTFKEQEQKADSQETVERVPLLDDILHSTLVDRLRKVSAPEIKKYREERRPFLRALQSVVSRIEDGVDFKRACREFLDLPGAIRCFALNAEGKRIGMDMYSDKLPVTRQNDFVMVLESRGSDWSRKDYYRRAVKEPGVVQVTRPYRSYTGYGFCVTVSLTARVNGTMQIICGDIDWSAHAHVSTLSRAVPAGGASPAVS